MTTRRHKRRAKKACSFKHLFTMILTITVFTSCLYLYIDFCRYPEKYITTLKYQLHNDIKRGDSEAIEYYNNNYISNGVYLYGEKMEAKR